MTRTVRGAEGSTGPSITPGAERLLPNAQRLDGGRAGEEGSHPEQLRRVDLKNRLARGQLRLLARRSGGYVHPMAAAERAWAQETPPIERVVRVPPREMAAEALRRGAVITSRDPEALEGLLALGPQLERRGSPCLSESHLLAAVAHVIRCGQVAIPHAEHKAVAAELVKSLGKERAKQVLAEQSEVFHDVLRDLEVSVRDGRVHLAFRGEDLTAAIDPRGALHDPLIDYPGLRAAVAARLARFAAEPSSQRVVLLVHSSSLARNIAKPLVQLVSAAEPNPAFVPGTVARVDLRAPTALPGACRAMLGALRVERQRAMLEEALAAQEIHTTPAYDLHKAWPRHPLMDDLRAKLTPLLEAFLAEQRFVVDPQDLEHQLLFRLTTYSPREIYQGGEAVVHHLREIGALEDWSKIGGLDPVVLSGRPLRERLVRGLLEEQYTLIKDRMERAGIDLGAILRTELPDPRTGRGVRFFGSTPETRWRLEQRSDGGGPKQLVAVSPDGLVKKVELRLVDQETAEKITFNLHYIHTLRAGGLTFGLFVEGMDLPFALETTELTDKARPYKQNAYLLHGFHPQRGLELTRLYTFPGSPTNIIGVLDGAVARYVKQSLPGVEFIATTVMPTYAKTRSTTIAGGIDRPSLVKRAEHSFQRREVGGRVCWEHLTTRRLEGAQGKVLKNHPEFPLLPVLEVLQQLGAPPSFTPAAGMEGRMVARGLSPREAGGQLPRRRTLATRPGRPPIPTALRARFDALRVEGERTLGQPAWTLVANPPRPLAVGEERSMADVARRALGERGDAFLEAVGRWKGPKVPGAAQPYRAPQETFRRIPWKERLDHDDIEQVLRGTVLVMEDPRSGQTQLIARDHHTVDALLFLHDSQGWLPRRAALHLDRHSDYEDIKEKQGQANGWWSLLPFFLRPDGGEPVLHPAHVIYGTEVETDPAAYAEPLPGPLNDAHLHLPPSHTPTSVSPEAAVRRAALYRPDFVSLDLDLFMPDAQRRRTGWVLDDPRFQRVVRDAKAVLFVLSPQFAKGGDWVPFQVQATHQELLATLEAARGRAR